MDRSAVFSWIMLFCCSVCCFCNAKPAVHTETEGKKWMICVVGLDRYRYTYGFEGGVYELCKAMAGKDRENLIIISPDSAAYNARNSAPGKIVHAEREVTGQSVNFYDDINVTYNSRDITTSLFYEILKGNKTALKGIGGEKVLESGPEDTVTLFFINLGDYGIMTLSNRDAFFAEDFIPFLEELKEDQKFKQMLIMVTGQNSGSMFDGYLCDDCNIIAITNTAKLDDELELCYYNQEVQAYTSTCFGNSMAKSFRSVIRSGRLHTTSLFDFYQDVREKSWYLESIPNLYGHLDMGNLKLSEFFPLSS